jgi:hypothetical protein
MRTQTTRPSLAGTKFSLSLFALLMIGPGVAWGQESSEPPANAHPKLYGRGWECDRGYKEVQQSCVAVHVPPHAFLNSFGDGWECDRGYRETDGGCAIVEVPANAFLNFTGQRWECDRGYRKVDHSCVAIQIPPKAFLDSSGNRWECKRGYQKVDEACILIDVPAKAFWMQEETVGSAIEATRSLVGRARASRSRQMRI